MGSFAKDRKGNFATILALSAVPVVLAIGGATDLAMAYRNNSALQDALDSALLAAGKADGTLAEKRRIANLFFAPQIAHLNIKNALIDINPTDDGLGLEGTATAEYRTAILGMFGNDDIKLGVVSEVRAGSGESLDIALVLDNTNSLGSTGLDAVRDAAQDFRKEISAVVNNSPRVQMAVVPFAGAVNVGRQFPRKYMDTGGNSRWHAYSLEGRWIAKVNPACSPNWGSGTPKDPGDGTVESFLYVPEWLKSLPPQAATVFAEVIGIRPAHAGPAQDHGMPAGYGMANGAGCDFLVSPPKLSNFDLFDQIPNVNWAGCVEAREDDYDTTDALPKGGDPRTLFVPFFWPDEPDTFASWVPEYKNNYLPDQHADLPWNPDSWAVMEYWGRAYTPTKYDGTPAQLIGGNQYVSGPNRGCPQPLLALTPQTDDVEDAIDAMKLVDGGGTVISEGVAWGWRVLSPAEPFTETSTAAGAKRIMIVMSDGENQLSRNPQQPGPTGSDHKDSPTISDYNAYGYLRYSRFGGNPTFAEAENEIDRRTLEICANAKADGIEIHTILFRSDSRRAVDVLKRCASSDKHFYLAADSAKLTATFKQIAGIIGQYRLSK